MRDERIEGTLILRAGLGEWYNQPDRGRWDMGEDAAHLPPARWHTEVEATIRSQDIRPTVIVIDTTEMFDIVSHDIAFLLALSKWLRSIGITLRVVAQPRVIRAYAILGDALKEHVDLVATLEEAVRPQ